MIVSQLLGSGCRPYVGYTHFLKAIHPEFPCYSVNIKLFLSSYNGQALKEKKITLIYSQWERKLRPNIYLGNGNDNTFVASYFDSLTYIEARVVTTTCMLQAKSTLNHL